MSLDTLSSAAVSDGRVWDTFEPRGSWLSPDLLHVVSGCVVEKRLIPVPPASLDGDGSSTDQYSPRNQAVKHPQARIA
jgi:hypothetical protein